MVLAVLTTATLSLTACGGPDTPVFWKIENDGATVYLTGTISAGQKGMLPLPKAMEEIADTASTVTTSISPSSMAEVNSELKDTAQDLAVDDAYADLSEASKKKLLDILGESKYETFSKMQTWLSTRELASLVNEKAGLDPSEAVDYYLMKKAIMTKRGPDALDDSLDRLEYEQLEYGYDTDEQSAILEKFLADWNSKLENAKKLLTAWRKGDLASADALAKANFDLSTEEGKALYQELVIDRNQKYLETIEELLDSGEGVHLLAPDLIHLAGENGLVQLLQNAGYTLEPVALE